MLNSFVLLSGYLGRAATQLVLLWAFARASGPSGTGEFAFALAVAAPVFAVFELALRNVYQTLRDAPSFRLFFLIRSICAVLAGLCLVAGSAIFDGFPSAGLFLAVLAMKVADSGLDICLGRLQSLGRVNIASAYIWSNTILTLVAIFGVLAAGVSATWAVVVSASASVVVLLVVALRLLPTSESITGPVRPQVRRILAAGTPLGAAQALTSLLAYLPIFYLSRWSTTDAVGVFAVCYYTVNLANLFFNSAMQTWLSPLRQTFGSTGRTGLRRRWTTMAYYLVGVGLLGALATVGLLPPVVLRAFGSEFKVDSATALPLALVVLVMGLEYSAALMLLVLNRYTSRFVGSLIGLAAASLFMLATAGRADVVLAGYLALCGALARCAFSLAQLVRENRIAAAAD